MIFSESFHQPAILFPPEEDTPPSCMEEWLIALFPGYKYPVA